MIFFRVFPAIFYYWVSGKKIYLGLKYGFPYFTFSCSPIPDEEGLRRGVLVTTRETTAEVQDARQLRTLRALASESSAAKTAQGAMQGAARVLAENDADLPFVLLYLNDGQSGSAHLAGSSGMGEYRGDAWSPGAWPSHSAGAWRAA